MAPPTPSDESIAVVIPARDEAATIGEVLRALAPAMEVIDELVVVDDHSTDDTALIAERFGAKVVRNDGVVGKGAAMRVGVETTTSDVVVFLDADVTSTSHEYVTRLIEPFRDGRVVLVKGAYDRPLGDSPSGGGRVTELTVRPALSVLFPELSDITQPIAGETAVRRLVFDEIELQDGYEVEIALLLDVASRFGRHSIAEVDLGTRRHRNRPIHQLAPMATRIMAAIMERARARLA